MAKEISKKQRRLDTDSDILDAALIVFGEYGYGGAKLADIAKHAHISSGLIVQNFGSKEKLLTALITREAMRLHGLFSPAEENWETAFTKIFEYVTVLFNDGVKNGRLCLKFFSTLLNNNSSPDSAFAGMAQNVSRSPIISALREGQKKGEIKDGDCIRLLGLFYRTAATVLAHCMNYNITPPNKEWFLALLKK